MAPKTTHTHAGDSPLPDIGYIYNVKRITFHLDAVADSTCGTRNPCTILRLDTDDDTTVSFTCATPWCGTPEPVMRFLGHLSRRERRQLVTLFAHLIGTSFEEERSEDTHTFTFVRRLIAPQRVMELPVRAQRRP